MTKVNEQIKPASTFDSFRDWFSLYISTSQYAQFSCQFCWQPSHTVTGNKKAARGHFHVGIYFSKTSRGLDSLKEDCTFDGSILLTIL